eukprot:jgi/Tetstr1/426996/TSEL_017203.t1
MAPTARTSARRRSAPPIAARLRVFRPDDIALERKVGQLGILNVSSYTPPAGAGSGEAMGLDQLGLQQLASQESTEADISVSLWSGRIAKGESSGARVVLKAYPARSSTSADLNADLLAANELATHSALQPPSVPSECPQICKLMGGFTSGVDSAALQQWLVFRNDGLTTAAAYAVRAAEAGKEDRALGEGEVWDMFDKSRPIARRQMLRGLAFMHKHQRLHQSLGPNSLVLSTTQERDAYTLQVRLQDMAFAVDMSSEALVGGATLAEIWEQNSIDAQSNPTRALAASLWQRARTDGAWTPEDRRKYGVADDVYAAGLLVAFMAFVPFCKPDSIDGPTLQRLIETTFQLDIDGWREYSEADERWERAVAFLDAGNGAGWDLLKAMLHSDWRQRATPEMCLSHPFLNGEPLPGGTEP